MMTTLRQGIGILILAMIAAVPSAADEPVEGRPPAYVIGQDMMVAISKSRKVVAAYSFSLSKWSRVELNTPLDRNVQLTVGAECAVFQAEKAIYAYSSTTGSWSRVDLEDPRETNLPTSVGYGFAAFQTSKAVYAYSATTGTWGRLPIAQPVKNQFAIHEQMVLATDGDSLCVFGRHSHKWTAMKLDSGEIVSP